MTEIERSSRASVMLGTACLVVASALIVAADRARPGDASGKSPTGHEEVDPAAAGATTPALAPGLAPAPRPRRVVVVRRSRAS